MEDRRSSNESEKKSSSDLPVYFRLMDVFLRQLEQSTPLLTTIVKDMQASYVGSVHGLLKAGEALESRSKMNVNLISGVSNTFDKVTPMITEAQLGVTEAMISLARQGIHLLRKSITERK